jgi:hypothetical protein
MKTRADTLGSAENESGRAKRENGTRRPLYIVRNVSENGKHEKRIERPRNRQKLVRERKT